MSGFANEGRKKVALIGAGMIGGSMAFLCDLNEIADVVLFDVVPNMPTGKGLDMCHASAVMDTACTVTGANDYAKMENADVVIITAGVTKIPGKPDSEWSRHDLLPINSKIMREVGANIKKYCPKAFVITITNPLDVMVKIVQESSGVPTNMICGMAGMLDSSRFRRFLADKMNVSPRDVQGMVIGVHGDNMVPLTRFATVNGIPLTEMIKMKWITQKEVDDIVTRTINGGSEIVKLLGQGSAYYAPACSAIKMAESYLKDQRRVMVCSCYLNGEYGLKDRFIGVPCVIGAKGVERVIDVALEGNERKLFDASVAETDDMFEALAKLK